MCGRDSVRRVRHRERVIGAGSGSQTVFYLLYINHGALWPRAHTSTGAHRIVCCSDKPTLKWYCGALVFFIFLFFILFYKGYCSVVREAGEQSPQTVGSATARIEIIRILLTAAPPVDSLYRVLC